MDILFGSSLVTINGTCLLVPGREFVYLVDHWKYVFSSILNSNHVVANMDRALKFTTAYGHYADDAQKQLVATEDLLFPGPSINYCTKQTYVATKVFEFCQYLATTILPNSKKSMVYDVTYTTSEQL